MNQQVSRKPAGLAGRLITEGLLDAKQASKAQAAAADQRVPFVRYLVDEIKAWQGLRPLCCMCYPQMSPLSVFGLAS